MPSSREISTCILKDHGAPAEHIKKWIKANYDAKGRDGGTALMQKLAGFLSQYWYKKDPKEWCRRTGVYDIIKRTNEIMTEGMANGSWGSFGKKVSGPPVEYMERRVDMQGNVYFKRVIR